MSLYAVLIACFSLWAQVDWAPDIGDEGFLWYGALKTFQGQVPILDFQAYFPGRYYFSAFIFRFLGSDLLALRIAAWLFQVLALLLIFRIARRVPASKASVIFLGILSVFWMTLPFRYFDSALVIAALFFAVRLLENPAAKRHFTAGVFAGLALFFGVNHGWYAFLILQGLVFVSAYKTGSKNFLKDELAFLGGLFTGCLPLLAMFFIPGFAPAFMDNLSVMLSRNNNPALPWPSFVSWHAVSEKFPLTHQRVLEFAHQNALSASFLLVPLFYAGSLVFVLRSPRDRWKSRALYAACAAVGTVYLHHILRRVNIVYLGEAIAPFLIGVWALSSEKSVKKAWRAVLVAALALMTFLGPGLLNNLWYRVFLPPGALQQVRIGPHLFWTETPNAREIETVRRFAGENVPKGETLFLAPLLPMYYCLLEKDSPVHQVYFTFPEPEAHQRRMVEELEEKKVRWAIVGDPVIDGLPHLRFSKTHALLWRYLNDKFEPYAVEGFPGGHLLWKKKL